MDSMEAAAMIVTTEPAVDGTRRLLVAGEIDMETVDDLATAMTDAITAGGTGTVIVDFTAVTFCDSSGLAALDSAYYLAGRHGVTFRLANPQPAVERVLQITAMLKRLTQP